MHYSDGTEVRVGHRVTLGNNDTGVVVFSIDTDEFSTEFPKSDWSYLGNGVMVRTQSGALVHVDQSRAEFISRA